VSLDCRQNLLTRVTRGFDGECSGYLLRNLQAHLLRLGSNQRAYWTSQKRPTSIGPRALFSINSMPYKYIDRLRMLPRTQMGTREPGSVSNRSTKPPTGSAAGANRHNPPSLMMLLRPSNGEKPRTCTTAFRGAGSLYRAHRRLQSHVASYIFLFARFAMSENTPQAINKSTNMAARSDGWQVRRAGLSLIVCVCSWSVNDPTVPLAIVPRDSALTVYTLRRSTHHVDHWWARTAGGARAPLRGQP
jgi:hypothetical protein